MLIILSSLKSVENINIHNIDYNDVENMVINPDNLTDKFIENENFSYIIKKNPMSGMLKRIISNGEVTGYYYNDNIIHNGYYILYFKDYDGSSYESTKNTIYLNPPQYVSSKAVLGIISEVLSINDNNNEYDKENVSFNTFHIASLNIFNINNIKKITQYVTDIKVIFEQIDDLECHYKVTFITKKSFNKLLNYVFVLMTMIAYFKYNNFFTEEHDYEISDKLADKIIKCINVFDGPYYLKYFVASRIMLYKDFLRNKQIFEKSLKHKLVLCGGYTAEQRRSYIQNIIFNKNKDINIMDIGCGEGYYVIPFSKKIGQNKYVAYDIDKNEIDKLNKKILAKELTNITVYDNETNFIEFINNNTDKYDVIISEVIEHMVEQDSYDFLVKIFNGIYNNFNKIIITTPNVSFNKNYIMENEFRHPDHKIELTKDEFINFMTKCINDSYLNKIKYQIEYVDIGDSVDDVSCSQGCIISI